MSDLWPAEEVRRDLRRALTEALKSGDRAALRALRDAVAAIDNAEAVAVPPTNRHRTPVRAEVERRRLSREEVTAVLEAELVSRRQAAIDYDRLERHGEAAELRAEVQVLSAHVGGTHA